MTSSSSLALSGSDSSPATSQNAQTHWRTCAYCVGPEVAMGRNLSIGMSQRVREIRVEVPSRRSGLAWVEVEDGDERNDLMPERGQHNVCSQSRPAQADSFWELVTARMRGVSRQDPARARGRPEIGPRSRRRGPVTGTRPVPGRRVRLSGPRTHPDDPCCGTAAGAPDLGD